MKTPRSFFSLALLAFILSAGAVSALAADLTGKYQCSDAGSYFVRQIGDEIWWVGRSEEHGHIWTNVFHGHLHSNRLQGKWADVPAGGIMGSGQLTLELTVDGDGNVTGFHRIDAEGDPFGGETWNKAN